MSDNSGLARASHRAGGLRPEPPAASQPTGAHPSRGIEEAIASMGRRVAARRKAMGLTLEQIGERAGLAKSYIWEIENGKNKNPTIRTAWHLGAALGWTLSEVIGVWEHADLLHPEAMRIAVQVDWLLRPKFASCDSDGSRMAETNEDSARGEAGPARAEGIAQPSPPTKAQEEDHDG